MNIFQAFKDQFVGLIRAQVISGTAKNVDANNRLFDIKKDTGGADLVNVKMRCVGGAGTKGIWMQPKNGAKCVVLQLNISEYNNILLFCEEFEELIIESSNNVKLKMTDTGELWLNGDQYGSLIKIADLVSKLNTVESDLNTIKAVFSSWGPVPNDGGAALKTAASTWYGQTLTNTTEVMIENSKVKHG